MATNAAEATYNVPDEDYDGSATAIPIGESYSTLTFLEHMQLLTPNVHGTADDSSGCSMIDFFINTMGFGLDPKCVEHVKRESGVTFVNCGACQLHLNDDVNYIKRMDALQSKSAHQSDNLPVYEVGLSYVDLSVLKDNLSKASNLCTYEIFDKASGRGESVRITDIHGRTFLARQLNIDGEDNGANPTIASICQRKVIGSSEEDVALYSAKIVKQYGTVIHPSNCQGIKYIEFFVPVTVSRGEVAGQIAKFYDNFFDAVTTVVFDGTSHIAIIGIGKIDDDGLAEQSLLFRERVCNNPPNDGVLVNDDHIGTGHHICIYVGANDDDFRVAATNIMEGGLLWGNKMFEMKQEHQPMDVESAMQIKQFRFKNIIDVDTGNVLYAVEHEIRSVSHDSFPGIRR